MKVLNFEYQIMNAQCPVSIYALDIGNSSLDIFN